MIDTKELRLGNYFKWSGIASMGFGEDIITEKNHYSHNQLREPIPLTEEWLLKFGFKEVHAYPNVYCLNDLVIETKPVFKLCLSVRLEIELKYVHRFQNIIHALTGEELKITN